jgi:lysophospholipid acyltransferase (LPLAT)-like uncharacterized protein
MKRTPFRKRVLGNATVQRVLARLGAQYIRLVLTSIHWTEQNSAVREQLAASRQPFILCFWHNRVLLMPYSWRQMPLPFHMLISAHRDGRLISQIIGKFGLGTVAGSKNKQGALAFRTLRRYLKDGGCVGITPDGPRGPRMVAGKGAVVLAQMAGVPLVPVSLATSRRRMLGSWDRFLVAWPFGRGIIAWGEPLTVPADADAATIEACRQELEARLNLVSDSVDQQLGHTPVPRATPHPTASPAVTPHQEPAL